MSFGEYLKVYRNKADLSINKLAKLSEVSPAYISKLQSGNSNVPSKKILFKIVSALRRHEPTHNPAFSLNLLKLYADEKNIGEKELKSLDKELNEFIVQEIDREKDYFSQNKDFYYNNLYLQPTREDSIYPLFHDVSLEITTQKPITDLKWLLNQKDFKLLYGRGLKLKETRTIDYNELNDEDVEMIKKLIDTYLSTKYENINEPKDYFNHKFNELLDDNLAELFEINNSRKEVE
ncbi:helix-turn-helix transcriptional regulator [Mammaliicoccus sp. N-M51]|uniref:helix-turn-helix domain-containing protein n=1 Tax=Mammaliicoccus sp. N-M51 TaxID=2898710 RepID=UPI001EFBD038